MKGQFAGSLAAAAASVLFGVMIGFGLSLVAERAAIAGEVQVAGELQRLAAEQGFAVIGLQYTEEATGRADAKDLYTRLRQLLERFNSVIVQGSGGKIERVIILGLQVPVAAPPVASTPAPDENKAKETAGKVVVQTARRGSAHTVQASVEGRNAQRIERTFIIDTGADVVVLPSSLLPQLGMSAAAMQEREMQTANGKVTAHIGALTALWLGDSRIPGVEAAFIDDTKLGSNALLGMSVLGRYRMTIDDEHGMLTLSGK
jgi:aspartyl protease family protein